MKRRIWLVTYDTMHLGHTEVVAFATVQRFSLRHDEIDAVKARYMSWALEAGKVSPPQRIDGVLHPSDPRPIVAMSCVSVEDFVELGQEAVDDVELFSGSDAQQCPHCRNVALYRIADRPRVDPVTNQPLMCVCICGRAFQPTESGEAE